MNYYMRAITLLGLFFCLVKPNVTALELWKAIKNQDKEEFYQLFTQAESEIKQAGEGRFKENLATFLNTLILIDPKGFKSTSYSTLLAAAVEKYNEELVEFIFGQGAVIEVRDTWLFNENLDDSMDVKVNALETACLFANLEAVKFFITKLTKGNKLTLLSNKYVEQTLDYECVQKTLAVLGYLRYKTIPKEYLYPNDKYYGEGTDKKAENIVPIFHLLQQTKNDIVSREDKQEFIFDALKAAVYYQGVEFIQPLLTIAIESDISIKKLFIEDEIKLHNDIYKNSNLSAYDAHTLSEFLSKRFGHAEEKNMDLIYMNRPMGVLYDPTKDKEIIYKFNKAMREQSQENTTKLEVEKKRLKEEREKKELEQKEKLKKEQEEKLKQEQENKKLETEKKRLKEEQEKKELEQKEKLKKEQEKKKIEKEEKLQKEQEEKLKQEQENKKLETEKKRLKEEQEKKELEQKEKLKKEQEKKKIEKEEKLQKEQEEKLKKEQENKKLEAEKKETEKVETPKRFKNDKKTDLILNDLAFALQNLGSTFVMGFLTPHSETGSFIPKLLFGGTAMGNTLMVTKKLQKTVAWNFNKRVCLMLGNIVAYAAGYVTNSLLMQSKKLPHFVTNTTKVRSNAIRWATGLGVAGLISYKNLFPIK